MVGNQYRFHSMERAVVKTDGRTIYLHETSATFRSAWYGGDRHTNLPTQPTNIRQDKYKFQYIINVEAFVAQWIE